MKIAVIGAGAWGTALGIVLHQNGHQIVLWGHNADHLDEIRVSGANQRYLPGVQVPRTWHCEPDLKRALDGAIMVVLAVPSKALRQVATSMAGLACPVVSVTKGIEFDTGLTMSGVVRECIPGCEVAVLSGPTLALEVAREVPTAIVAASQDPALAQRVQQVFHRPAFRVYSAADMLGVELGGALKNVIAIAAGVCDGLGFGDNAKAALITRGIVEMRRLGVACGACAETFNGLSGLGDLTVTCFSKLSRNRALGEKLGRGGKAEEIVAASESIAEGYPTTRAAVRLANAKGADAPIVAEVHAMLYEDKDVRAAVRDLIHRDSKAE